MNNQISELFSKFADRLNNENDLSDITWALMDIAPSFQNAFIKYCFNKEVTVMNETIREYAVADSRPDFYFEDINNNKYLIEVKIYDKNMHFDQYNNNEYLKDSYKCFIANYQWPNENGWIIKTWNGFCKFLLLNNEMIEVEQRQIVNGYLSYLKKVISFIEVKSMNISNLESIYSFYQCVNEVVKNYDKVVFEEYNKSLPFTSEKYGKFVYFENNKNENVYLWLGIYFSETIGVYIEFDYKNKYWVPQRISSKLEKLVKGNYYEAPTNDGRYLWFRLQEQYFNKLCSKETHIEEQRNIIYSFLDEIIQAIIK